MDVDLVYLWVDGSDPEWRAKRNASIGASEEKSAVNCEGRFADNDELKYSLRSVDKYAPWIHRVFIVTDNQVPAWLDTSNPKVRIVDHKDILPDACLPCFNSVLLEHFIYRIPGLSEHFLYANDDTFINKPVAPETFFAADGFPVIRLTRSVLRDWYLSFKKRFLGIPLKNYIRTIRNSAELVKKRYGIYYKGRTHHNIDAYLKSTYQHTAEVFCREIAGTFSNHVRRDNDIQRNIYAYTALAEKRGHLVYVTQRTSFRFLIYNKSHYGKLRRYDPVFFCMNDSEHASDSDRQRMKAFLAERFPEKSQFEK